MQNDVREVISEKDSGGRPTNRHDRLQHIWAFNLTNGNQIFQADAHRSDGGDADSLFIFEWATSASGPWTQMFPVTKTSDDDSYQVYDLGAVSGTIYVQARDDDRTSGQKSHDTLYVDHMFIGEGTPPTDPPGLASNPMPSDGATNVSPNVMLSWTAGTGSASSEVYFGINLSPGLTELQGSQTGTTFEPAPLSPSTIYYWRIDETNEIGTTPGTVWSFTTSAVATSMHVDSIDPGIVNASRGQKNGRAYVLILDDQGAPVSGASVTGTFSGSFNETVVATANSSGVATLRTSGTAKKGIAYTVCVNNVTHTELSYDSGADMAGCASY